MIYKLKRFFHWGPLLNCFCIPYLYWSIKTWILPEILVFSTASKDLFALNMMVLVELYLFFFVILKDPGYVPSDWASTTFFSCMFFFYYFNFFKYKNIIHFIILLFFFVIFFFFFFFLLKKKKI